MQTAKDQAVLPILASECCRSDAAREQKRIILEAALLFFPDDAAREKVRRMLDAGAFESAALMLLSTPYHLEFEVGSGGDWSIIRSRGRGIEYNAAPTLALTICLVALRQRQPA